MLTGAMPMVVSDHFDCRKLCAPDLDVPAQPDGDGHRGNDPRSADGRGVIVIGGCDKTLPAQVMAAVSADLPTVVISRGADGSRPSQGRGAGRLHRLPQAVGQIPRRRNRRCRNRSGQRPACAVVGTCMVMGTASTMACITEALGLSLPMSATIPAPHAERFRLAEASGKVAAAMAKAKGPRPSELLTASSSGMRRWCCRRSAARPMVSFTSPRSPTAPNTGSISRRSTSSGREGAGIDRPETLRRTLHGALSSCRRRPKN